MPVLPSFKKLRQENEKFNIVFSFIVSFVQIDLYDTLCQKTKCVLEAGMPGQSVSKVLALQTSRSQNLHEKESGHGCRSL